MRRFRMILILGLVMVLMFVLAVEGKAEVYKWKMTSPDVKGDNLTVFGDSFAELVKEKSGGRIEIEVFPQGTLGSQTDIIEIVQLGQAQIAAASTASFARFVPQTQVLSLQYLGQKKMLPWLYRRFFRREMLLNFWVKNIRKGVFTY